MQAESDSLGVNLFSRLKEAEELEQFLLVLFADAEAGVFYLDLQVLGLPVALVKDVDKCLILQSQVFDSLDKAGHDRNCTVEWSEFYSIGNQVKQYLLESLLVEVNGDLLGFIADVWKQFVLLGESNADLVRFEAQNISDFSDCLHQVKLAVGFTELSSTKLGVI